MTEIAGEFNADAGHLVNMLLGFGGLKDKTANFKPATEGPCLSRTQRLNLYNYCPFIANAIDFPVDDSLQKYVRYSNKNEEGDSQPIQALLDGAKDAIAEAWKMARIHGWAGVLLYVDDTADLMQPLRKARSIGGFRAYSGGPEGLLTVAEWDDNPISIAYGQPKYFSVGRGGQRIHPDRLLLFYGVKRLGGNDEIQSGNNNELGYSIIDRIYREFQNFDVACQSVASTMPTMFQDTIKIPELAKLSTDLKKLQNYVDGLNRFRSTLNMLAVDAANGGIETVERNYSGIPELVNVFAQLFAGATNIPDTMLFNRSPSGQTSGRYQSESWAQFIAQQQQLNLCTPIEKLVELGHQIYGKPADWDVNYPSILTLSEKEKTDLDKTKADTIKSLGTAITPEEARKALENDVPIGQVLDNDSWEGMRSEIAQEPEGTTIQPTPPTNPGRSRPIPKGRVASQ